ncbi:MAG TPA: aminopeptidase [Burkholderiaceae bacterium]|nr:aminopeptidase [Burkholderiaceae bacterium]
MRHVARVTVLAAALAAALGGSLAGCSTVGYLAQSVNGHLGLINAARPVKDWLAESTTPQALRERLVLSQQIRDFSIRELRLPDNSSYRSYADLHRDAAVWNVVAAPELSLKLKTSCFPVVGCVGYRGYYGRKAADREAQTLRAEGNEAWVYGVPAYSTLGWTNWLGGDPLLNTFIRYPEGELARMIFHELAHQVAYAKGDTTFNESFATAVETIGITRWLDTRAGPAAREEYARFDARRHDFRALTQRYRALLQSLYDSDLPDAEKRERKAALMQQLKRDHATMKAQRWGGYSGYDAWFEQANNASFGVLAAYAELVPDFERLFAHCGGDFDRFYAEVRRLATLSRDERHAILRGPQ